MSDAGFYTLVAYFVCVLIFCLFARREGRKLDCLLAAGEVDLKRAEDEFEFFSRMIEREKKCEFFCGECADFPTYRDTMLSPNERACEKFQCGHPDTHEFSDGDILCAVCGKKISHSGGRGRARGGEVRRPLPKTAFQELAEAREEFVKAVLATPLFRYLGRFVRWLDRKIQRFAQPKGRRAPEVKVNFRGETYKIPAEIVKGEKVPAKITQVHLPDVQQIKKKAPISSADTVPLASEFTVVRKGKIIGKIRGRIVSKSELPDIDIKQIIDSPPMSDLGFRLGFPPGSYKTYVYNAETGKWEPKEGKS